MKILLTGFEPFAGEKLNPSWEAVRRIGNEKIEGLEIETLRLPTVFGRAIEVAIQVIGRFDPDIVICIGQAGGRSEIGIERVAINVNDAGIKDNEGNQPVDEPIAKGGPTAYWSTLPIKSLVRAIREEGIPAGVSNSAGTYVCNNIMYGILNYLAGEGINSRAGLIHIPFLPEQAINYPGKSSMSLETIISGLKAAIKTAAKMEEDENPPDGKIH